LINPCTIVIDVLPHILFLLIYNDYASIFTFKRRNCL
jgi:hypothetical protein